MPASTLPASDFELLFDALPAPVAALAPDGTVQALNAALTSLLAAGATVAGQPFAALHQALAPRHVVAPAPDWAASLHALQASGAPSQVLAPAWAEVATAAQEVPSFWQTTLQPVRTPAGELHYVLLHLLNVSEHRRLERILDLLPLTISTMEGPEHTFTFLSAQAKARMGTRAAVGRTVAESLPEVVSQGYLALLDEVRDTGRPRYGHEEHSELLNPDTGQLEEHYSNFGYLPLLGNYSPGVLAYSLEVTEQVRARRHNEALQAEARAADQRLRRVTESLPTITFICDQAGRVLYLSPQWYAYTGTTPTGELDSAWETHVHPDDLAHARAAYSHAFATGSSWRYEARVRRHDGEYRWFVSQAVPEPQAEAEAAGRLRQWFGSDLDIHELREAQYRLEAENQRLGPILSQTPGLITTVEGPDHRFAFTNPNYQAFTHGRAQLGRSVAECFPEVVEQGLIELLDYVYQTGRTFTGQEISLALDAPDGTRQQHYLDFTYQPLRNSAGEVTGVLGFAVDVTKQVLARREAEALQAEVNEADQRRRRQAEILPIITFTTDATGRTTYMSPQWYEYTGQTPGDWAEVDNMWQQSIHPDDWERTIREIKGSISEARLGRVELRLRKADGQYQWFVREAVPELDADGKLLRRYGYMVNVQELRHAQQRLEEKDRLLSQILERAPAYIATLDGPEHRYSFFNAKYGQLVGDRVQLGKTIAELLPEVVGQGFVALYDEVYRTGVPYKGVESLVRLKNTPSEPGQERYLDFSYLPLFDSQEQVTGIMSYSVDVTARVRARQQAEALALEMSRRDEHVRAITASVPVFIFNFDTQGAITYTNPYFYEYTGQDPAGPLDDAWQVLQPEERAAVAEVAQAAMAAGQPWQAEFRVRRHDGELRWFQAKAQPYLDGDGQLVGFSVATIEVHDLHERTHELARSRADFAALADNIAQLAWMADATGHIFWYNQQWYDYTGSNLEDMQGWGWKKVHDPALVEGVNQRYMAAIAAGEPWEDTFPIRRHDGVYRWFLSRARPIRESSTGQVVRWFGTNTDVTDLRQLQEQLRESEEELRIQAESIPQQVWTALPDGTVDFYNHRTAAYLGETMEKNGAANWLNSVHPDDQAPMQQQWQTAIASQRYYEAEFRLRRYDGQYRWFLGQAQARRAVGGQVVRWYGTNTDIHQQRLLTEELGRREEQFRFLAESVPQIVWTSLGVGGNDYVNQRWFDYTGLTPTEDDRRANWAAVIHPDDLALTNQRWQHSVNTGEFFEIEYRFRRHDGVYRWFLGQGRPQRHADGHIIKWFGTCTDIDDQRQARQLLEDQNARLRRTNEDLDNFVYTASHDLKQPINNMAGIFEELTRTAYFRDPDAIKLISYFERALAQIYGTIDSLGAIVQGQRQQQESPTEDVALAPLVSEVIGSLQAQVTQLGATFELDFATYPVLRFVRANLQSVLFNLISNSLKYAAPGRPPRIRISSAPDALTGRPVLTVQDNGIGIDLERFGPQLFQLFRRFHTHVEGTGMGLYLVNRIVQNHGGHLEVDSEVDQGTTFRIYL